MHELLLLHLSHIPKSNNPTIQQRIVVSNYLPLVEYQPSARKMKQIALTGALNAATERCVGNVLAPPSV